MSSLSGMFPVERSSYYQLMLIESGHIAKNQWYLGEKMGHAVDWNYAQWNWIMAGHRQRWMAAVNSGNIILPQ